MLTIQQQQQQVLLVVQLLLAMFIITDSVGVVAAAATAESASSSSIDDIDISITMTAILVTLLLFVYGLTLLQTPNTTNSETKTKSITLSTIIQSMIAKEPSKRSYEYFVAIYTPIWIVVFSCIVIFQLYESFTAITYNIVCFGLALPILLQPILYPIGPDIYRPLIKRYSFKVNIWIAIYSFIGNYWYTHYFYSVLHASYTMPSIRLNNVPIQMYGATHFYFTSYHYFSNCLLRSVITLYQPSVTRSILFIVIIVVFSYFTAFMETLTISSYPYYTFENKFMAYTIGSAFYGIYFLVSFPAFFYFDTNIDNTNTKTSTSSPPPMTVWDTIINSCGYSMIILLLLDFVRLYLNIPLIVGTIQV